MIASIEEDKGKGVYFRHIAFHAGQNKKRQGEKNAEIQRNSP